MKTLTFDHIRPVSIDIPETWNELTRRQLLNVSKWLDADMPEAPKKLKLLMALMDVRWYQFALQWKFFFLDPNAIPDLLKLTDFLFEENKLSNWLIDNVKVKGQRLFGPMDKLSNITLGEFSFTETYFMQFHQNQSDHYIHKLIAVLYRPADMGVDEGDIREEFNEYKIENRAILISKLPNNVKLAILYNYIGCRNAIVSLFPRIFNAEGQDNQGSKFGWADVIVQMAGEKFGDVDETSRKNLFSILIHQNHLIDENERMKKEQRK